MIESLPEIKKITKNSVGFTKYRNDRMPTGNQKKNNQEQSWSLILNTESRVLLLISYAGLKRTKDQDSVIFVNACILTKLV